MYEIREVIIGTGEQKRQRLVIEFSNPNEAIIGEFLMTDATLYDSELVQEVEEVMRGERHEIIGSGNRCGWRIDSEKAIINDLFQDMGEDIPFLPTCTLATTQLYELLQMWLKESSTYYGNN